MPCPSSITSAAPPISATTAIATAGRLSHPTTISQKAAVTSAVTSVSGTMIAAASHEATSARTRAIAAQSRRRSTTTATRRTAPPIATPRSTPAGGDHPAARISRSAAAVPAAREAVAIAGHAFTSPVRRRPARRSMPLTASRPTVESWRASPKKLMKKAIRPRGKLDRSDQRISTRSIWWSAPSWRRTSARVSASWSSPPRAPPPRTSIPIAPRSLLR